MAAIVPQSTREISRAAVLGRDRSLKILIVRIMALRRLDAGTSYRYKRQPDPEALVGGSLPRTGGIAV